jgi:hypothetical protein
MYVRPPTRAAVFDETLLEVSGSKEPKAKISKFEDFVDLRPLEET